MSLPTFIVFLAVLFVGVPSALRVWRHRLRVRNPTALALVATWAFGQAVYAVTHECLPVNALVLQDMVVIVAIFCKREWRSCSYETAWKQLTAFWLERSPWDRAILALFPLAWLFYAPLVGPFVQYWILWCIGMAQIALAASESLHQWRGRRGAIKPDQSSLDMRLRVSWT